MARQELNIGAVANDGTGDTLREAGEKINSNFSELYYKLGGDSDSLSSQISLSVGQIVFEGSIIDDYETALQVVNPTADRTINLPNASGTVVLDTYGQTLTNKTLTSPVLTLPQINDTSATHQYVFGVNELSADRTVTLPLLTGNDTFVFQNHTQVLTNKSLTTPTLTSPSITTGIFDVNGAELIAITSTSSAVNEITVANAATGTAPSITSTGADANINLSLSGKGTGGVVTNKPIHSTQTITANGAASSSAGFIICNKATALAVSLANGTTPGEVKYFVNKGVGDATITFSSSLIGTSITIQHGEAASCGWDGTYWYVFGTYNGTVN